MEENLLFQKIYCISSRNMIKAGQGFTYNEKAFQCIIGKDPQHISVHEFDGLEDEELFVALYIRFLNRLPDPGAKQVLEKYEKICDGDDEMMKFCLIRYLSKSPEYKNLNKKIDNNNSIKLIKIYKNYGFKIIKIMFTERILMGRVLFHRHIFEPIWTRLPKSIRNVIRRICGKETKEW